MGIEQVFVSGKWRRLNFDKIGEFVRVAGKKVYLTIGKRGDSQKKVKKAPTSIWNPSGSMF